jgi:hypothetical protein
MAQQIIDVGTTADDGTGEEVGRALLVKINENFSELYVGGFFDGESNFVANAPINSIDATALSEGTIGAFVAGGGTTNNGNHLGRGARPFQAYGGTASEWTDDTAYGAMTGVLRANASSVATIGGGYDHINNQIAGTISGGGHNYIKYNVNGHSVIAGGSYNLITGGRCFIGGGRDHWAGGNFAVVVGGDGNHALADNALVINGAGNIARGTSSTILNGTDNETGTSANSSGVMGTSCYTNGAQSVVMGRDGHNSTSYAMVMAAQKPSGGVQGAAQTYVVSGSARTTDDIIANTNLSILLGAVEDHVGSGTIYISGVDEATNQVVLFKQDFGFKMVGNGTTTATTTFFKRTGDNTTQSSTNTAPGSTSEVMILTPYVDEITVGECHLRSTSGASASILVRVTGKASTNITWSASVVLSAARIA